MELVVAHGLVARLRGLIGRREWPFGVALEIPRCRSVHTFGMRFALDLVWLDGDRRVVRVDRAVPPCRVRSCRAARSVLEIRTPGIEGGGLEGGGGSSADFVPVAGTKSAVGDRVTGFTRYRRITRHSAAAGDPHLLTQPKSVPALTPAR
jgi:uncharacterized membrane protein (UPF0127 family)